MRDYLRHTCDSGEKGVNTTFIHLSDSGKQRLGKASDKAIRSCLACRYSHMVKQERILVKNGLMNRHVVDSWKAWEQWKTNSRQAINRQRRKLAKERLTTYIGLHSALSAEVSTAIECLTMDAKKRQDDNLQALLILAPEADKEAIADILWDASNEIQRDSDWVAIPQSDNSVIVYSNIEGHEPVSKELLFDSLMDDTEGLHKKRNLQPSRRITSAYNSSNNRKEGVTFERGTLYVKGTIGKVKRELYGKEVQVSNTFHEAAEDFMLNIVDSGYEVYRAKRDKDNAYIDTIMSNELIVESLECQQLPAIQVLPPDNFAPEDNYLTEKPEKENSNVMFPLVNSLHGNITLLSSDGGCLTPDKECLKGGEIRHRPHVRA